MSTTAVPERGEWSLPLPHWRIRAATGLRALWLAWRWDVLAVAFFSAATLVVFKDAPFSGLFYKEFDTTSFYYPNLVRMQELLQSGRLPLWTPAIFAGFPLYADGEAGLFYLPNLLALIVWDADAAVSALRWFHYVLAASFTYAFTRSIGIDRWGAVLAGLTFAFGSFLVMQMHHTNVLHSAVWLPFILWFTERWISRGGPSRAIDLMVASLGLAGAALGVHYQVVLMILGVFALYTTFRVLAVPIIPIWRPLWPQPLRGLAERGSLLLVTGLVVPAVGLGLGAVQLLPVLELAGESWRGGVSSLAFSNTYNASWFNLGNLVQPYLFRDEDRLWWSLWAEWETNVFLGIVPLLFVLTAIVFVRSRQVAFFAVLLVAAFLLALGQNAPGWLFESVWNLPGFSVLRAPGRFTYVFVFAGAILAGFGLQWAVACWRAAAPDRRRRLLPLIVPASVTLATVAAWLWLRAWLSDAPAAAAWLQTNYLGLSQGRTGMSGERVRAVLESGLQLSAEHTIIAMVSLAGVCAIAGLAVVAPRFWRLWASVTLGLAGILAIAYANDFHPLADIRDLTAASPAVRWLQQAEPLDRSFVQRDWYLLQPNHLLPFGIQTPAGYSSLQPERQSEYIDQMTRADATLLDLAGVRYLLSPRAGPVLPRFRDVAYFLRAPLALGQANNPNAHTSYAIPDIDAIGIRILANYDAARPLPVGTALIDITVFDEGGDARRLTFDAGDPIGRLGMPEATLPANAVAVERIDGVRREARGALYFAEANFDEPVRARQLTADLLRAEATTTIYGLALIDADGRSWQLPREAKLKYAPVFEDPDVIIFENLEALPRAFVVPEAVLAPDRPAALRRMIDGAFDPTRTVVLESTTLPDPPRTTASPASAAADSVAIITYQDERVVLRADTVDGGYLVLTDAWYPGWRAFVDGYETRIHRGDYLFRTLPLGPGSHLVEFVYEPFSLRLGAAISLVTGTIVMAVILVALVRTRRQPRH